MRQTISQFYYVKSSQGILSGKVYLIWGKGRLFCESDFELRAQIGRSYLYPTQMGCAVWKGEESDKGVSIRESFGVKMSWLVQETESTAGCKE